MSARKKYSQPKNIYFTDTSSMMYMLFIDLECKNGLLDGNEKDRGDIQKNRYDRNSSLKINYHAHHLCYVTNFNSRRASILIWRLRFQCKWWLLHFTLVLCVGYVNLSRVIFMVVISDNHDVTIGNKYVIDINMIGLEASRYLGIYSMQYISSLSN